MAPLSFYNTINCDFGPRSKQKKFNNMKKLVFLLALSLCTLAAWAYDFSAVAPTGQTLYYTITAPNTVSVTHPATSTSSPWTGYSKPTGSLTIPSSVTDGGTTYSVTAIDDYAFALCSGLTSVTIPNSVTSIGDWAFSFCSGLTSVTIPNSVTSIADYAFYCCSSLTSVTIPNSVTSIGIYAFGACSGLTSVTIPNSVTSIGNYAFSDCSGLTSVTIPNSVTSIGTYTFYGCSSLTSVTIPNSVTSIGDGAFYYCSSLTSVTIPNSVTSIGSSAFYYCRGLTSVTIPNSVTSIGSSAFFGCSNLKTVYNLSGLTFTKGVTDYGYVAYYANRVLNVTTGDITNYGSGKNTIHQIAASYSVVDVEDGIESHIPRTTIPTNFIYADGGSWKANEVVLTDCQDAFEAPVDFVAERATYSREFVNGNRSTLYLPFSAPVPEGFEVYDFANFDNSTLTFSNHMGNIAAYTPYLVGYDLSKDGEGTLCTISQTNAFFPASTSANYHPVTRNNMTFSGVIERTQMYSSNNYGYTNGFFVHSNGEAHVNPFRSFFTYDAPVGAPAPASVLNIEFGDPVGIQDVVPAAQQYDGRYGNDVFDMMGRIVRKDADNLNGLPRGIYIWKGKKVFAN